MAELDEQHSFGRRHLAECGSFPDALATRNAQLPQSGQYETIVASAIEDQHLPKRAERTGKFDSAGTRSLDGGGGEGGVGDAGCRSGFRCLSPSDCNMAWDRGVTAGAGNALSGGREGLGLRAGVAGAFELMLAGKGCGFFFQFGTGLCFLLHQTADFRRQIRCGLHGVGNGLAGSLRALICDGFLMRCNPGPGGGGVSVMGLLCQQIRKLFLLLFQIVADGAEFIFAGLKGSGALSGQLGKPAENGQGGYALGRRFGGGQQCRVGGDGQAGGDGEQGLQGGILLADVSLNCGLSVFQLRDTGLQGLDAALGAVHGGLGRMGLGGVSERSGRVLSGFRFCLCRRDLFGPQGGGFCGLLVFKRPA